MFPIHSVLPSPIRMPRMKTHRLLGMGDKFSSAIAPLAMLILYIGRSSFNS